MNWFDPMDIVLSDDDGKFCEDEEDDGYEGC